MSGCTRCGDLVEGKLYATLGAERSLCCPCWKATGKPFPEPVSQVEAYAAVVATRERMLKRGGTAAHLVKKGLT